MLAISQQFQHWIGLDWYLYLDQVYLLVELQLVEPDTGASQVPVRTSTFTWYLFLLYSYRTWYQLPGTVRYGYLAGIQLESFLASLTAKRCQNVRLVLPLFRHA